MADNPSTPSAADSQPTPPEVRVDQAHALRGASEAPESVPAPQLLGAASLSQEHAQQLAEWLQRERSTLDQRTRMLETQETDLEEKVLAAQAWLEEQRAELEQREEMLGQSEAPQPQEDLSELTAQLEGRERELDQRQARIDTETESLVQEKTRFAERQARLDQRNTELEQREQELEQTSQGFDQQQREAAQIRDELAQLKAEAEHRLEQAQAAEDELAQRERAIEMRKQEIDHALERYDRLGVSEKKMADLQEKAALHAERERGLIQLESMLEEDRAELAQRRERLTSQEQAWQERAAEERRHVESDRAAQQAEAKSESKRLARWEEEVERREEGLAKLKCELEAAQREVLEMRLATEETWAQLTGLLAPAALTRSISRVRAQLADYYSRAQEEIAESRGQLRDASVRVEEEMQRLEERRIAVEEWANRRHEELGLVAESLESREKELDRQQRMYEQMEARWSAERTDYREQIRLLLSEMREQDEPTIRLADAA